MHEASIVTSLLDIVTDQCRKGGYRVVSSVKVKIGRGSGILPEALRFAFQAARTGTVAAGAVLEIDEVRPGGICRKCGKDVDVEDAYQFQCPLCGEGIIQFTRGRELELVEMDVD